MRLSEFIVDNGEEVLQAWEDFARTLAPAKLMNVTELRNDAGRMLQFIAEEMETPQSPKQQHDKSIGKGQPLTDEERSAAHDHGLGRAVAYFSLGDLLSEFRALRASVTRLWLERSAPTHENALQLVRFNEAVDQLIAESVVRYAAKLERDSAVFTASIGHDLRNPLNAVVMWASALMRAPALGDRERDTVKSIEQAAHRITGMVGDLQDFTQTRLGSSLAYKTSASDVSAICREVVSELRAARGQREIRLLDSGGIVAVVDRQRLSQAISNLVGNAVQHGDDERPVTVRAASEADTIVIGIHNEGPAIPPEHLIDIFEPLKTRPRSGTDGDGHLGLGLYIARRIVEGHGGTLKVSSTQEAGTTFEIRLPKTPDNGVPGGAVRKN